MIKAPQKGEPTHNTKYIALCYLLIASKVSPYPSKDTFNNAKKLGKCYFGDHYCRVVLS